PGTPASASRAKASMRWSKISRDWTHQNDHHQRNITMTAPIALPSDADHTGRDFGEEELALLKEVIDSGTLNCTKGTQVKELEKAFAARYGMPYSRAVTSGTAAVHC